MDNKFQQITPEPVKEPHLKDAIDLGMPRPVEGEPIWERRFAAEHLAALLSASTAPSPGPGSRAAGCTAPRCAGR